MPLLNPVVLGVSFNVSQSHNDIFVSLLDGSPMYNSEGSLRSDGRDIRHGRTPARVLS